MYLCEHNGIFEHSKKIQFRLAVFVYDI